MLNERHEALRAESPRDLSGPRALFPTPPLERAAGEGQADLLVGLWAAMIERLGVVADRPPGLDHQVPPGMHSEATDQDRDHDGRPPSRRESPEHRA